MMVNEATIQHLHEMRLSGMAGTYRSQNDDPSLKDLSFDERFGLMVDTEWSNRSKPVSRTSSTMRIGSSTENRLITRQPVSILPAQLTHPENTNETLIVSMFNY